DTGLRLSARDPAHSHDDERDRELAQSTAEDHQDARPFPDGRGGREVALSRAPQYQETLESRARVAHRRHAFRRALSRSLQSRTARSLTTRLTHRNSDTPRFRAPHAARRVSFTRPRSRLGRAEKDVPHISGLSLTPHASRPIHDPRSSILDPSPRNRQLERSAPYRRTRHRPARPPHPHRSRYPRKPEHLNGTVLRPVPRRRLHFPYGSHRVAVHHAHLRTDAVRIRRRTLQPHAQPGL